MFERYFKNHFLTEAAAADIDDSTKRKRIRVSLNNTGDNGTVERNAFQQILEERFVNHLTTGVRSKYF